MFVYCVYVCRTLATILSIGYGDIHAVNTSERIYSICVMLTGGVMFGAIISQIARLTESRNPNQKLVAINMTELSVYLQQKKFPQAMNSKIKVLIKGFFHCIPVLFLLVCVHRLPMSTIFQRNRC